MVTSVSARPLGYPGRRTITGHAGLARNTSGDKDNLRALESITETRRSGIETLDGAVGVDVAQISSDTCWVLVAKLRAIHHVTITTNNIPGPPLIS